MRFKKEREVLLVIDEEGNTYDCAGVFGSEDSAEEIAAYFAPKHISIYSAKLLSEDNDERVYLYTLMRDRHGRFTITERECLLTKDSNGRYLQRATIVKPGLQSIFIREAEGRPYGSPIKVWFKEPDKRAAHDIFVEALKRRVSESEEAFNDAKKDLGELLALDI